MARKHLLALGCAAVLLSGCSSRPRNFAPVINSASADAAAHEAAWIECRQLVAQAISTGSGRGASAAGGAAAGAAGGVAAGAAASGATYGTIGAAAAAGAMVIAAVPVFGLAGAWGVSKIKKTKNERAIKSATAECLAERGYPVDRWRVMSKREARSLDAAHPAEPNADGAQQGQRAQPQ